MERALYCSLSELIRLHDSFDSNPRDWRLRILKELDSVYAYTDDPNYLFVPSKMDEQTYLSYFDGTTLPSIKALAFSKRMALNEWLGHKMVPVKSMSGLFPERLNNGAVCKSIVNDDGMVGRNGVELIDDINDKWATNLRSFWSMDTVFGEPFSWSDFFGGGVPTSSAAVIVDRYIFKNDVRTGVNNLTSILQKIVPENYERQYAVTFLFQYSETMMWGKDKVELLEALKRVNKRIALFFIKKRVKFSINFIAIVFPERGGRDDKKGYLSLSPVAASAWKKLQYFSHDRRILTNYYQVSATFGFSAEHFETASSSQRIYFESLLSNVDNPRQKERSIPFYSIPHQLGVLSECLSIVPDCAVHCYGFNPKERSITECKVNMIKNPLIELSRANK